MLHTEPSFCIYNSEEGVEVLKNIEDLVENDEQLERTVTIGDTISDIGGADFSFRKKEMGLIEEDENEEKEKGFDDSHGPMYLATGFGIDGIGVDNGGLDFSPLDSDENGDVGEYYKRVLQEDPSNLLFLKKYAQLLQSKGDLSEAEHYCFQATLVDPKDGDTLSQYAKLVWELHRDKEKASDYFERATHAAPENRDVLAAYASFLWDINDDESDDETVTKIEATEAATAGVSGMDENSEEYHMKMIKENPCDPLVLRNYAEFLSQSKGDLRGAEEYYSRAILADPTDGESISHYAQLIWQLHHDKFKALSYFKRAVQASPENSDVLGAYARFCWEAEEDEDEDEDEDEEDKASGNEVPLVHEVVSANA